MSNPEITNLTNALSERLFLCNDQVEESKNVEQFYDDAVDRHSGWQKLANEAITALKLVAKYQPTTEQPTNPDMSAQVAAELRSQYGDIDLARHIESNDLRAIDCNTP